MLKTIIPLVHDKECNLQYIENHPSLWSW